MSVDSLLNLPLEQLICGCERERTVFRQTNEQLSPYCMALFRRAFAGDQDAWQHIIVIFGRMQRTWIQHIVKLGSIEDLDNDDLQGIIHEALCALYQAGQRHEELTATDNPAKLIKYWKKCVQTTVLRTLRTRKRQRLFAHLHEHLPAQPGDPELKIALWQRIRAILSEEELLILTLDMQGYKPQDIVKQLPEQFPTVQQVYQIKQNYLRRLQNDPTIRELHSF